MTSWLFALDSTLWIALALVVACVAILVASAIVNNRGD